METAKERRIRLFFDLSILGKGLISFVEVVAGIFAIFVPVSTLTQILVSFAQSEFLENGGDFIASHILQAAQQLSLTSSTFIAIYLLSRGFIKLGLVVALFKNQLWAYPSSLVILGLFVLYQVYQYILAHSALIALLTIFDLIVMYFIWLEYRVVRDRLKMVHTG